MEGLLGVISFLNQYEQTLLDLINWVGSSESGFIILREYLDNILIEYE